VAGDLGELAHDTHGLLVEVQVASTESGQLTPAEATENREEHEGAVTLVDRVSQREDLRDGKHWTLGGILLTSALDLAWVPADQPIGDSRVQNGPEQPVGLGDGRPGPILARRTSATWTSTKDSSGW
jgi:hypothetical protein